MIPLVVIVACIIVMPLNGGELRKLTLWGVIGLSIYALAIL